DRFHFADEEIAVMIGSHGGEPFHVRAVRSILKTIGLDEKALQCGAHAPYHRPSAHALRQRGEQPTALPNNCAGKQAGTLALAVAAMRGHPEMIGGTDRLCTALMRAGRHGLLAKIGAEGMYGLAWQKDGVGFGLALKISDGEGQRARFSAALEALRQLEVLSG